jgi:transcriptional regulator with XRE-family HTH domain
VFHTGSTLGREARWNGELIKIGILYYVYLIIHILLRKMLMSMRTSYRERNYEYGEAMLKLRTAIGLTQGGLGKLLGVSWRAVAGWEAGSSYPKTERLKALIELAIQHQAFSTGSEAEEIRRLWKVAHQKVLLDEDWLCALLEHSRSPQDKEAVGIVPCTDPVPCATGLPSGYSADPEPCADAVRDSDPASCASSQPPLTPVPSVEETMSSAVHGAGSEPGTASEPSAIPTIGARLHDKTRGRRKRLVAIVITLVLLTIIGSVGMFFFLVRNKTATDPTYPRYLPGNGTLVFFDPLSQEDGNRWSSYSTSSTGGACQFTGGAYHVSQQKGYFAWCGTQGTFSNFAFEVQLTITQGDCGGMLFWGDDDGHYYDLQVCENGTCQVFRYLDNTGLNVHTLFSSRSSAIHTGQGHQNKIAMVSNGSIMTFYVNEQQINQVQDSSYTSGKIALIADPQFGHATDVAYSNARLWRL